MLPFDKDEMAPLEILDFCSVSFRSIIATNTWSFVLNPGHLIISIIVCKRGNLPRSTALLMARVLSVCHLVCLAFVLYNVDLVREREADTIGVFLTQALI
jgi:hypothetical protein